MFILTLLLATVTLGLAQEPEIVTEAENIIISLDLSNRSLDNLADYDFSKLKELESIDLSYNDLTYIGDDQFRNNLKLKSINLAGNPHLKLSEYSTFLIANIENLNLSHCNIDAVYESSFDGLLELKSIDLSYNPIKKHGISYHALKSLMRLREITVSEADPESFAEICEEIDLTIFIKSESNNFDIKCKDVRAGKLEAILSESETKKEAEIEHEVTVSVVVDVTEASPIVDQHVEEQKPKEENEILNTTQDDQKIEINTVVPDVVPPQTVPDAVPPQTVPDVVPTQIVPDVVPPQIVPDVVPPQTVPAEEKKTEPKQNENTETGQLNPTAAPVPIVDNPEHKNETPNIELTNPKAEVDAPKNEVDKNNDKTSKADDKTSKNAKTMLGAETDKDGEAQVQSSESSSQSSAGTTVLVILVIAAVVGGLAAFGYKYYKSGKEDEKEPIEKELQEITIDSKTNGTKPGVENEPLIHQRKYSVEIKEVDETSEGQNRNRSGQNGSSYIPITTVEKMIDEETSNNETSK